MRRVLPLALWLCACGATPPPDAPVVADAPPAPSEPQVIAALPEGDGSDLAAIPRAWLLDDAHTLGVIHLRRLRGFDVGGIAASYAQLALELALTRIDEACGFDPLASVERAVHTENAHGGVTAIELSVPASQMMACAAALSDGATTLELDGREILELDSGRWLSTHEGALVVGDMEAVRDLLGMNEEAPASDRDVSELLSRLPQRENFVLLLSGVQSGFDITMAAWGSRAELTFRIEAGGAAGAMFAAEELTSVLPLLRTHLWTWLEQRLGEEDAQVLLRLFDFAQIGTKNGRVTFETTADDVAGLMRVLESLAERPKRAR